MSIMLCIRGACTNSLYFYPPSPLLASTSPQSLCLPSRHANMLRFFPARRCLCWRRLPRKAFVFRRGTPTCSGFSRPAGVIVGVDLLAKPLPSVGARQHAQDFPGLPALLLASTSSQSLCPPSGHANILRFFSACRRHCWRRLPHKAFVLRRVTPTCSGSSRPRRKPLSAADRHNGKSFGRYGGFFFYRI